MKEVNYKVKYESAKNAYKNLENDYNEIAKNYAGFKDTVIEALENLKGDDYCDYDVGYNVAIEHCISVVVDMNVPSTLDIEDKQPFLLTRLEHELLKFFADKLYKYIARDKNGALYTYKYKPDKVDDVWGSYYGMGMLLKQFENLFKFIEWDDEEPFGIEELLKNCEVIDND